MVARKDVKQRPIAGLVVGLVLILGLGSVMVIAVEEMAASKGDYRRTLWDRISGKPSASGDQVQVGVQLAQEMCRQRVVREVGPELMRASFDNRSSRYNEGYKVHTIFLDLQVRDNTDDVYARCDISAVERVILEFRIHGMGGFFWG